MTFLIHWKALKTFEFEQLMKNMQLFAIRWHKEGKCSCMNNFKAEINANTYIPCKHLNDAEWKEFKKKIKEMETEYMKYWQLKLASSFSNRPNIEFD